MTLFVGGMIAGAVLTALLIGFFVVVAEDEERQEQSRQKQIDPWQWRMEDDLK